MKGIGDRDTMVGLLKSFDRRLLAVERKPAGRIGESSNGGGGDLNCEDCDDRFVNVSGDTMTGALMIPGPPTAPTVAANKDYVDTQVATRLTQAQADARYVNLTGDTMTGPLVIPGPPTLGGQAANKAYVDLMDEVIIATTQPADPNTFELWYDPDATIAPAGMGFVFTQGVASDVWVIDHPLTFQPNITVTDSAGDQVEGDVVYTDSDTITITFSAPFAGTAYLS